MDEGTAGIRARRWTSVLVVTEVILTLVLAGAGFMMKSFVTMYRMDIGADISHVLTLQLFLPLTNTRSLVRARRSTSDSKSA